MCHQANKQILTFARMMVPVQDTNTIGFIFFIEMQIAKVQKLKMKQYTVLNGERDFNLTLSCA